MGPDGLRHLPSISGSVGLPTLPACYLPLPHLPPLPLHYAPALWRTVLVLLHVLPYNAFCALLALRCRTYYRYLPYFHCLYLFYSYLTTPHTPFCTATVAFPFTTHLDLYDYCSFLPISTHSCTPLLYLAGRCLPSPGYRSTATRKLPLGNTASPLPAAPRTCGHTTALRGLPRDTYLYRTLTCAGAPHTRTTHARCAWSVDRSAHPATISVLLVVVLDVRHATTIRATACALRISSTACGHTRRAATRCTFVRCTACAPRLTAPAALLPPRRCRCNGKRGAGAGNASTHYYRFIHALYSASATARFTLYFTPLPFISVPPPPHAARYLHAHHRYPSCCHCAGTYPTPTTTATTLPLPVFPYRDMCVCSCVSLRSPTHLHAYT